MCDEQEEEEESETRRRKKMNNMETFILNFFKLSPVIKDNGTIGLSL